MKREGQAIIRPRILTIVFLVFGLCLTAGSISAQSKTTTEANDKYGEGGTLETTSDEQYRIICETWKDKRGYAMETHRISYDSRGITGELWSFEPTGRSSDTYFFKRRHVEVDDHMKTLPWDGKWDFGHGRGDDDEDYIYDDGRGFYLSDAGKEIIEKKIEDIESHFAKTGTYPVPKKSVTLKVSNPSKEGPSKEIHTDKESEKADSEQPVLPKTETFTPELTCQEAETKVSVDVARMRIEKQVAHIEDRKKQMADAYYYGNSVKTLEGAFKENGIRASMAYTDSWGNGEITAEWSTFAKPFYDYHLDQLKQSMSVIERRGYSLRGELATIDRQLRAWDNFDQNLGMQFRELVKVYLSKAKVYDEQAVYMKNYFDKFDSLTHEKPYPSNKIDALNVQINIETKAFNARVKRIEGIDRDIVDGSIKRLAGTHIIDAVKETPAKFPACRG